MMRTITKTTLVMFCLTATSAVAFGQAAKKAPPPDDKAAIKQPEPEAPPPVPKPSPELLALGKKMKGTWKCKTDMFAPDGTVAYKTTMTMKYAMDLDNMFLKATLTEAKKKGVEKPMKFTSYITYDGAKWHQMTVNNWGGWGKGWSTGADASGKVTWEVNSTMMGTEMKMRDYEEWTDKKTLHVWGEYSTDGKAWTKAYDASCKK